MQMKYHSSRKIQRFHPTFKEVVTRSHLSGISYIYIYISVELENYNNAQNTAKWQQENKLYVLQTSSNTLFMPACNLPVGQLHGAHSEQQW